MNKLGKLALAAACIGIGPACSGSGSGAGRTVPADATFKNGTRLKAVYQLVEGAPPFFLNWYDTQLQVDCTFTDVGLPDRLVCFSADAPGGDVPTLFAHETTYLFTDSACTSPVVDAAFAPCTARFFATGPELGDGCGTPVRLYNLGPALPRDPAGLYHVSASGTGPCEAASASQLETYTELHSVGPEIPLDGLVSGTYQHEAAAERIVALRIAGSDGSIAGEAWTDASSWAAGGAAAWDNERDEMVSTSLRAGSRWFPTEPYQAGLFSDPACSVMTAIGAACRVAARECFIWAADECGYPAPTSFYELGAPVADQASVYYDVGSPSNACEPYDAGAGSPIVNPMLATYTIGAPVAVTVFAEAQEVHTGTGPVKIIQAAGVGGGPAVSVGFFDSAHGQPCTFQRNLQAADGVVRCLPPATDPEFYADANCSVPLYLGDLTSTPCPSSPAAFVAITENVPAADGCYMPRYRRHIYPVRDTHTGNVYEKVGSGPNCFDLGSASDWGDRPLYATGPEIPASEFAALDEVRPN